MSNNLTPQQAARIFALYLGAEIHNPDTNETYELTGVEAFGLVRFLGETVTEWEVDDCKLLLTPLLSITDEHAVDAYNIRWTEITEKPTVSTMKYQMRQDWEDSWFLHDQHDYLISQGYAVPLFIAPGHPDNGKTAIELGLAIDRTKNV